MRWALVVVLVCGACEPQGSERKPRWPHHRQQEEQRISDLESQVKEMHAELAALKRQLEARQPAPAPAPVSAPP